MIRHVVFFTVKPGADVDEVREGLMMLGTIPHVDRFEVGRNLGSDVVGGDAPDLVVYGEFADAAALDAYRAHPTYAACIDRVRPLREMRIAADFLAG